MDDREVISSKYKVGDKVRIKNDADTSVSSMRFHLEEVGVIDGVISITGIVLYGVRINDVSWWWCEDDLEEID